MLLEDIPIKVQIAFAFNITYTTCYPLNIAKLFDLLKFNASIIYANVLSLSTLNFAF